MGELNPLETSLASEGRTERFDLEKWIASDPSIIRPGLEVIGSQVTTRSGPLDLLAVDRSGDLVVIELKRDQLPREALAQAIDYASDVASWSIDKIREVCTKHMGRSLEDVLSEAFPDLALESLAINEAQRITLVGFAIEPALERMIEWLSGVYGVGINAVSLKYIRTSSGNEVLTRTTIISEQLEASRIKTQQGKIAMSDEPGTYEEDELRELLLRYLSSQDLMTARLVREVLLPASLEQGRVTREEFKHKLVQHDADTDPPKAGRVLTVISTQMGMQKNDFLRQVIGYDYPTYAWEKDNYFIRDEYKDLVRQILANLQGTDVVGQQGNQ